MSGETYQVSRGTVEQEYSAIPSSMEVLEECLYRARIAQARVDYKRLGKSRDSLSEVDQLTLEAYEAARAAYGTRVLENDLHNAGTDTEKNALVVSYLIEEQHKLDAEVEDPTELRLRDRARRIGRGAIQAAGGWLSRGSRKVQFAKGALVSAAFSVPLGAFVGGVGAFAGMSAVRYLKARAVGSVREVQQQHSTADDIAEQMMSDGVEFATTEEAFERASELLRAEREANIARVQERNAAAGRSGLVAMAVGAVAGAAVGGIIHEVVMGGSVAHALPTTGGQHTTPGVVAAVNAHDTVGTVDAQAHTTTGSVAAAESHITTGNIEVPSGHATTGVVTVSGAHETTGGVNVSELSTHSTNGSVGLSGHATTGKVDVPAGHHATGKVDVPAGHNTTGTVDVAGGHVTTGNVEVPSGHEATGGIDTDSTIEAGSTFTVESGHGDTHELLDFAKANDVKLTPEQAWKLHTYIIDQLRDQGHGLVNGNYITLGDHAGADAYSMGHTPYEVGIAAPSHDAHFTTEAQALIEKSMADLKAHGSAQFMQDSTQHATTGHVDVPTHATTGTVDVASGHATTGMIELSDSHVTTTDVETPLVETVSSNTLPVVGDGEGLNSFVAHNYDGPYHHLTDAQSLELSESLYDTGYMYDSSTLASGVQYDNPYGISMPGGMDTGMDTQINDMVADGRLDVSYHMSAYDWARIEDMLRDAAAHDKLAALDDRAPALVNQLGPLLKGVVYPDGTSVVEMARNGSWSLVDSSYALPQKALNTIYTYLNQNDTAARAAQRLAKVI